MLIFILVIFVRLVCIVVVIVFKLLVIWWSVIIFVWCNRFFFLIGVKILFGIFVFLEGISYMCCKVFRCLFDML